LVNVNCITFSLYEFESIIPLFDDSEFLTQNKPLTLNPNIEPGFSKVRLSIA